MDFKLRYHPIISVDDYIQDLYIDALCMVTAYDNQNPELAFTYIEHIIKLADKSKKTLSEHIKSALQFTPERFEEFISQCSEHDLQCIFLLDCLLIINTNCNPSPKQLNLYVEVSTVFGCSKYIFLSLINEARSILCLGNVQTSIGDISDIIQKTKDTPSEEDKCSASFTSTQKTMYIHQFRQTTTNPRVFPGFVFGN